DGAHGLGRGVLLDVVYNHLGPDGNYLGELSDQYISRRHKSEWGDTLNFDGEGAAAVRAPFVENAGYWIEEFHVDGLRLDAIHAIVDDSPEHILHAVARRARATGRPVLLVAEDDDQTVVPVTRDGLDGVWNDDFHHAALVAATGRRGAYLADYRGSAAELAAAARHGFLYQGQRSGFKHQPRGRPAWELQPDQFVVYLDN